MSFNEFDFSSLVTAPVVKKVAAPFGAPQIVNIPDTRIPSPLAPNLAPQTIKDLKEFLTGCEPDGKPAKGHESGVEIWESWKRAWDLWNNHYIEGRHCPTWIKSEYDRLKKLIDDDNRKRRGRRPPPPPPKPPGGTDVDGNGGQRIYDRKFARHRPVSRYPDRIWIPHRYRTKKISVPTGNKIQQNNPNSIPKQVLRTRRSKKVVEQKAGATVKVYRQISNVSEVVQVQTFRENGPWHRLRSWSDLVSDRTAGKVAVPTESEDTPEPELEPTGVITKRVLVQRVQRHLEDADIEVERQPNPLRSWKELVADRAAGGVPHGIPASTSRDREGHGFYDRSRSKIWVHDGYELEDTGETEVLLDDRLGEVPENEDYYETDYDAAPPVEVDEMMEITIPQWLEVDDPTKKKKKTTTTPHTGNTPPPDSPPTTPPGPPLPPVVVPNTDHPLEFEIFGRQNHPRTDEWKANLERRWDAANPVRANDNPNDPAKAEWIARQLRRLQDTNAHIGTIPSRTHSNGYPHNATIPPRTHSNGYPMLHHQPLNVPALVVGDDEQGDEDMADVSDQDYGDYYDDDEDMDDVYEQRALGDDDQQDSGTNDNDLEMQSNRSDDVQDPAHDSNDDSDSDDHTHKPTGPDLGPLPRGPDGGAAGFFPLKIFPEFAEPELDANGDYVDPEWIDELQNMVWRPRRVGEKTVKIDMDEPWEKITDLEVDGGLDCGRSPFPVLRPVNKYFKNHSADTNTITFRKEKVWDGVTGSIFNMPTKPDEAEPEILDEKEQRATAIYSSIKLDERRRHNFFPLDIRRAKMIDPATSRPYSSEIKQPLPPGETETEFDFPWSNPLRQYPKLEETDPWWVTPEQEKLRDIPPRRHPMPKEPEMRINDAYLPLDDYRWKQERLLDENNQARYYVTNLHGGTLIINGVEVKKGCIAGPLPAFAVIETEGRQISFWWGLGGRNWGEGPDHMNFAASWRQLRRMPGWEHVGLNAGVVWNRIVRDRLQREESGNDLEDDEQWEEWKNPPPPPAQNNGGGGGGGPNNTDDDKPADAVHPPIQICYSNDIGPPCCLNTFNPPDLFETEQVELQWLHTRAAPLRENLLGLANASQRQVAKIKALTNLIEPADDNFWPGPAPPQRPEVQAQQDQDENWPAMKEQVLQDQTALLQRHNQRRLEEEAAKDRAYQASIQKTTLKRQAEYQLKDAETKRRRLKLEQDIREAQANEITAQQAAADAKLEREDAEKKKRQIQDEARKLALIIGLDVPITPVNLAQAYVTRFAQWKAENDQKAIKLANVNNTRASMNLPAIAPQLQMSDNAFQKDILNKAQEMIDPTEISSKTREAQNKQAVEDANRREEFNVQEAQKRKEERDKADRIAEAVAKEQEQVGRDTRHRLLQAQQAQDEKRTQKALEDLQRATDEQDRRIAAQKARQEQAAKDARDAEVAREAERARLRAETAARILVIPEPRNLTKCNPVDRSTPPATVQTAAQRRAYREAVNQRTLEEGMALSRIEMLADAAGLTPEQYVQEQYKCATPEDYVNSLDYDTIVRAAIPPPGGACVGPDEEITPDDTAPAGTYPPPTVQRDPGQPPIPPNLTSGGQVSLRAYREAMRSAVHKGVNARARRRRIPNWQVAHELGWESVGALINYRMSTITENDLLETLPDPPMPSDAEVRQIAASRYPDQTAEEGAIRVRRDVREANTGGRRARLAVPAQKIIDAGLWEDQIELAIANGPSGPDNEI